MGMTAKLLFAKAAKRLKRAFYFGSMDDETFIDLAYYFILRRFADPGGKKHYLEKLANGQVNRDSLVSSLASSREFQGLAISDIIAALHYGRMQWIKGLPTAKRILDLGGSATGDPAGAMVALGYPYEFEQLTIVDLPQDEKHALHTTNYQPVDSFDTGRGIINYVYCSMSELAGFADGSVDMIHSGQSIEHVTFEDAETIITEAMRILAPGGFFCLDTPNYSATKMQFPDGWSHPDHKYEYTHEQLSGMLLQAGFELQESKGVSLMPKSFNSGVFDAAEVAANYGLYDDIARCYLLGYRCRKPN